MVSLLAEFSDRHYRPAVLRRELHRCYFRVTEEFFLALTTADALEVSGRQWPSGAAE